MEVYSIQQLVAEAKKDILEFDVVKVDSLIKEGATLLIDVREPDEFAQGHILDAINVPRGVLEFRADQTNPNALEELSDKSVQLIVYCRSGARSALAAQVLGVLGYKSVISMAGGYLAWEAAQLHTSID
jgi:sulfur dioxygenase